MLAAAGAVVWAGGASASECLVYTGPNAEQPNADSDNDGVKDGVDQCIGKLPGITASDAETGCPLKYAPQADTELVFDNDNPTHRPWYITFWDGKCQGPVFGCEPFSWEKDVINGLPENAQAPLLKAQLMAMGRYIGHEWAKDNFTRLIDSIVLYDEWAPRLGALRTRNASSALFLEEIADVCQEAEEKMNADQ